MPLSKNSEINEDDQEFIRAYGKWLKKKCQDEDFEDEKNEWREKLKSDKKEKDRRNNP